MGFLDRLRGGRRSRRQAGSVESQASFVGEVIAAATYGLPRGQSLEAKDYADEGFAKNVIAYRCVSEIAKAVATVPVLPYRNNVELARESVVRKRLARPNPLQGWQSFVAEFVSYHRIAGNTYLEVVAPPGRPPQELYALRPDRMEIKAGTNGFPSAYIYTVGSEKKRFDVDYVSLRSDILHWHTFHPLDDYLGLSPISAAAYSIDQHNEANAWNTRLIRNDCRPPGTFKAPPGLSLKKGDREDLEKRINDKYAGPENAGKVLVQAGFEWTPMGFSPHDMDWLNAKHTSARDVCNAFGYPPMLLGIPGDNTYSNYKEARLALYEDTVIPLTEEMIGELNNSVVPRFGPGIELRPDWDAVSALSERRAAKWDRIDKATFLSPNEKREELGYEPKTGGDDLLVPAALVPLGVVPDELSESEFREELRAQGWSDTSSRQMARLAYGG